MLLDFSSSKLKDMSYVEKVQKSGYRGSMLREKAGTMN